MFSKSDKKIIEKKLKDHKILLIGGAGFIGHNLALQLKKFLPDVFILDNLMFNSLVDNVFNWKDQNLRKSKLYRNFLLQRFKLMRNKKIEMKNADARNISDITRAFYEIKPTKIVHLAAISSSIKARFNPGLSFDLQLHTLRNILELCRENSNFVDQFVFISSSTVYGNFKGSKVNEDTRPKPKGIYASTKYMGERLVRVYNNQYGLGTTIIRPSALYGERCVSQRVSQMFIENALEGKKLKLEGGGDGLLDFTYVDDLVQGIIRSLAFHLGPKTSQTFNITYGNARTIKELYSIISNLIPKTKCVVTPRITEKPIRGTLSTKRAEEILNFKSQWPLKKGYTKYVKWYIKQWNETSSK